jgi:hypothetical protein
MSSFFIFRLSPAPRSRSGQPNSSLFGFRRLIQTKLERQPVDLAGELERGS